MLKLLRHLATSFINIEFSSIIITVEFQIFASDDENWEEVSPGTRFSNVEIYSWTFHLEMVKNGVYSNFTNFMNKFSSIINIGCTLLYPVISLLMAVHIYNRKLRQYRVKWNYLLHASVALGSRTGLVPKDIASNIQCWSTGI